MGKYMAINDISKNYYSVTKTLNANGTVTYTKSANAVANDTALIALPVDALITHNTGKMYVKIASNIFDLVTRDYVSHEEMSLGDIAYKNAENKFTETNHLKNIQPNQSNNTPTYDIGAQTRPFKDVYASNFHGVADSSDKLTNDRTITFTGDISGAFTFDGTADKSVSLTIVNAPNSLPEGNLGSTTIPLYLNNGQLMECEEFIPKSDQSNIAYTNKENTFTENNNFENVLPSTNSTYDLGSSLKKWNKTYTDTLNLSGSDVTIESGTSTSSAVGDASTPVYIDANGIPRACNINSMISAAVASYISSGFLWDITKVGCLRLVLIASRAHVSGLSGDNPLIYKVGDIIDLNKIDVYQAGLFFQLSNDDMQYSFPNGVIDPVGGDGGHSISAIDKYTSSKITAGTWRLLSPYFSADSGSCSDIGGARLCLIVRVA